jgi:hypothetical protein
MGALSPGLWGLVISACQAESPAQGISPVPLASSSDQIVTSALFLHVSHVSKSIIDFLLRLIAILTPAQLKNQPFFFFRDARVGVSIGRIGPHSSDDNP